MQALPGTTGLPQLPASPQNRRMLAQEGAPAPAPQAEAPVMLTLHVQRCRTILGTGLEQALHPLRRSQDLGSPHRLTAHQQHCTLLRTCPSCSVSWAEASKRPCARWHLNEGRLIL